MSLGPVEPASRSPQLDGVRGLAILLVLLYHLSYYGFADTTFARGLLFIPSLGWTGVDLFFVLSGFLITRILLRERGAAGFFRRFYGRRFLRIFPLYYLVLFVLLVAAPWILGSSDLFWDPGSSRESFWYWAYLSNIQSAWTGLFHHRFLSISWTLAIEEQFYLAWPLAVGFLSRAYLGRLCWGLIAFALALRVFMVLAEAPPVSILTFTFCRLDLLAAGALISMHASPRIDRVARWTLPLGLVAYLCLVALAYAAVPPNGAEGVLLSPDQRAAEVMRYTRSGLFQTAGYSVAVLVFASLLVRVLASRAGSLWARGFALGPLRSLGKYSYGIYLLHLFVAELARAIFDPAESTLPFAVAQGAFWVIAVGLSWAIAALVYYAWEIHFLRLKDVLFDSASRASS